MQMDDLKCRKRILRRMGYCTAGEVIETKGRIACELSRYILSIINTDCIDLIYFTL